MEPGYRFFARGWNHIWPSLWAIFLLGCASVQSVPQPPIFSGVPIQATQLRILPMQNQRARVAVRETGRRLEARLTERLECEDAVVQQRIGRQVVRHELSKADETWKWIGYGGAALTASLVAIGMARGQDPGQGVLILGLYGIPLTSLGMAETLRSRNTLEPVRSKPQIYSRRIVYCPPSQSHLNVRFHAGQTITEATVGYNWTIIASLTQKTERAEIILPISQSGSRLDVTLPENFEPPLTSTRTHVPKAATAVQHEVDCKTVAQKTIYGALPLAYWRQAIVEVKLRSGASLTGLSKQYLGNAIEVWQIYALNPRIVRNAANIYQGAPTLIKLPKRAYPWKAWTAMLPQACR